MVDYFFSTIQHISVLMCKSYQIFIREVFLFAGVPGQEVMTKGNYAWHRMCSSLVKYKCNSWTIPTAGSLKFWDLNNWKIS